MKNYMWKIDPHELTCTYYLSGLFNERLSQDIQFIPEIDQQLFNGEPDETLVTKRVFDTEVFQELVLK